MSAENDKIRKGDRIRIRPEWQDPGDDKFVWFACEDEDGGRVLVECHNGMNIIPTQVVKVEWIEKV
ncbi:hypothetical protein GC163_12670 [bacterium]|nr:hypothetical protein [bacterium]